MILSHQENVQLAITIIIQEGAPKTRHVLDGQLRRLSGTPGEIETGRAGNVAEEWLRGRRIGGIGVGARRHGRGSIAACYCHHEDGKKARQRSRGAPGHRPDPPVEFDLCGCSRALLAATNTLASLLASCGCPAPA